MPVVFVLTTPAVRVGLSRSLPLPSRMIEAQALKSILMSTVWPSPTWMGPPTTCPGGIFRPVLAWLESRSSEVYEKSAPDKSRRGELHAMRTFAHQTEAKRQNSILNEGLSGDCRSWLVALPDMFGNRAHQEGRARLA